MQYHFGLKVLNGKQGLKLTRENYAKVSNKCTLPKFSEDIYSDENGTMYSDEWCKIQLKRCLENFDLNMEFFSMLDHDEFNQEIDQFLKKNKQFVEVYDLNLYDQLPGYYLMILDEYCQLYIGTSVDIKRRIRQHWTKNKPFDRLLFPMGNVNSSILSIDSFHVLDTTRIYAYSTTDTYTDEDHFINQFSDKFVSNRIGGGEVTNGLLQAISMMKKRKLISS